MKSQNAMVNSEISNCDGLNPSRTTVFKLQKPFLEPRRRISNPLLMGADDYRIIQNYLMMNESVSDGLFELGNNFVNVNGFILFIVITATVISFPVLYIKVRCKFPVTVNCWFCNKNSKVPYNDANCWDCPFCDQYNGFNEDGSYNKEIKEQHDASLNSQIFTSTSDQCNKKGVGYDPIPSNGLCKLCNINQQLKIQQLARFVPLNENNYDQEVGQFRQQLEKSYGLCSQCENVLKETLQNQQYKLLKDRLNIQRGKINLLKSNGVFNYDAQFYLQIFWRTLYVGLKLISGIISATVFLSCASQLEIEHRIIRSTLPEIFFFDCLPVLQEFLKYLTYSFMMKKELISIGLLCYALSSFYGQIRNNHSSLLLSWGILYVLCWSDATILQFAASAVCILLGVNEVHQTRNYTLKKLLKSSPVKVESSEMEENLLKNTISSQTDLRAEVPKNSRIQANINESLQNSQLFNEAKKADKSVDTEKSFGDESPKEQSNGAPGEKFESQTPHMKSRKIYNKKFLATLDKKRIEKELSPSPEIFRNLSNLKISNQLGKTEKPSNFLFENHNFEERCKRNSSIIKSPKFVKSTVNSWANGEMPETISRSSTPSSGYSSQKTEKAESRRSSFTYPKVVSPVPFVQNSPSDAFDCWDKNNPYFTSNNFQYFTPGCMPFHHFSNPMGHTAVYTYTRPASYPFAFPPSGGSPGCRHSPGSPMPCYSDGSETENLFQNASMSYQSVQKWDKIKSALYNVSVFFNIMSTCVLAYYIWSGVISLTGH